MMSQPASVHPTANPAGATANVPPNSLRPGSSHRAKARRWGTGAKLILALVALFIVVGVGGASFVLIRNPFRKSHAELVLYTVHPERLEQSITERGALESANNNDIYCRVKAKSSSTTVATSIKWVIDDGSHVRKNRPKSACGSIYIWNDKEGHYDEEKGPAPDGPPVVRYEDKDTKEVCYADLLVDLDSSGLEEQLKTQKITMDNAEAAKITAEEDYKIQLSDNFSKIETAKTTLAQAEIAFKQYTGRNYSDAERDYFAKEAREDDNADLATELLVERERKYYKRGVYLQSLSDLLGKLENAQSDLEQERDREAWARRMVKKGYQTESQAQAEKSRLESYGINVKQLRLQIDTLVRYTKRQEKLKEISAIEEAKRALDREKSQATAKEVQARTTRDSKKSVYLQESARYRELAEEIRKCKIRAPQDGMVVYYMPEQSRWGAGSQQSIVAQGEPVREGQKLMQIPDLKNMLVNTKVHEAMVSRVKQNQPAVVRVSSFPDKVFKGSVDSVATVASQQDFFSSDVKVYTTKVRIDDDAEELKLKPGMSAEVIITTGDPLEKVLAVPVEAIVGSAEMGEYRTVYVLEPNGPEEREVIIGASNDSKVEVKVGLQEGEQVVLNPKVLVGDSAKTRTAGGGKKGRNGDAGGGNGGMGKGKGKGGPPNDGKGGPPNGQPKAGGPPGGAPKDAGKGAGNFTPEQRKQMEEQVVQRFKSAKPEQRKAMLEQTPEQWRDNVRQLLQKNGIEVPK